MGSLTAGQMFTNELNALKGWPNPYALDKAAYLDTAVETDPSLVKEGMVVHIDPTSGKFQRGVAARAMPMFLIQNATDFDANSDKYGTNGQMSALVALGAYELQTSQYVTGGTYAINTVLVAASGGDIGKINSSTGGQTGKDIIGVCSSGIIKNAYGINVVSFWPTYLPAI